MQPTDRDEPRVTPRRSERVTVAFAALVLLLVLIGGFARLGALLGFDEPLSAPNAPATTLPGPGVASATGSVLPADPAAPDAGQTTGSMPTSQPASPATSTPVAASAPTSSVPVTGLPPRWPVSLPDPGEHRVLAVDSEGEERWLLAVPGNVPLAGGRFLAGLEDLDWEVSAVSTPRTLTAVGTRQAERVSVTLRTGGDALPSGWLLLDVVYQPTVPEFTVPPSSTIPPEDGVTKRS